MFFECKITCILRPNANNIIDILILVLVVKTHITTFWIDIIIKHAESNLKLQLVLSKLFCAQAILNSIFIELGVIIVTHNDEFVHTIKRNY